MRATEKLSTLAVGQMGAASYSLAESAFGTKRTLISMLKHVR
jgi:hypothetical protein